MVWTIWRHKVVSCGPSCPIAALWVSPTLWVPAALPNFYRLEC